METKYSLVEIKQKLSDSAGVINDMVTEKYPFKKYLFETALKKGLTDMENQEEFDRNIEIYKQLKEFEYLDADKLDVVIDENGKTETFTRDEALLIIGAMEKKVVDVNTLIENIRKRIDEMYKEPKIVVYTCITGGYDNLIKPTFVTPGVDYVCFTDNPNLKSNVWKIRPIPEELLKYSKVKQQRGIKILPHRYLPEYDISIWIDANVDTKSDLKTYLKGFDFARYSVFIPEHPRTKCIYKEKDACVRIRKITGDQITLAEKQMKRYRDEGYPENYGLVQSNIIVRKHGDPYSKELMEKWWSELRDYSHRDQLSFNYALWKTGDSRFKYLIKTTCNSRVFRWGIAHKVKK